MSSCELAIFYQHSLRVTDSWGLYTGQDLQSHKPHLLHRLQLHKSYVDKKKTTQCVSWFKKKRGAKFHLPHPHTCGETLSSYTEGVLPAFVALSVQIQSEARPRSRGGAVRRPHTERLCVGLGCGFASRLRAAYYMEECTGLSGKPANRMLCTWDVPDAP